MIGGNWTAFKYNLLEIQLHCAQDAKSMAALRLDGEIAAHIIKEVMLK